MKEILFRGKRVATATFVYGFYSVFDNRNHSIVNDNGHFWVIPETVGQFTGLTDKNGTKIFEGDILRYGNRKGYVNYGMGCFNVHDSEQKNNPAIDVIMDQHDIEVIGNIHDNPELLEGS